VRDGDTFTVTRLDRLARSVPDALAILTQLSDRGVRFALGGSAYDWHDPMARMFLQILAVIAEFEAALIRQRTREGMTLARSRGRLRGKPPSLAPAQDREIRRMHDSGDYPIAEIAGIFKVSRPTIYRALQRTAPGSANLPPDTRPGLPSLDKYDQLLALPASRGTWKRACLTGSVRIMAKSRRPKPAQALTLGEMMLRLKRGPRRMRRHRRRQGRQRARPHRQVGGGQQMDGAARAERLDQGALLPQRALHVGTGCPGGAPPNREFGGAEHLGVRAAQHAGDVGRA